ncbi:MAG: thioredoxin family protein [Pirellulaceae bacterium]
MTICRNVVVLAGVLLASWIASAHRSAGEELNWLTDLDEAKQVAQAEGKSIFVDFTGSDWCVWCIRLDREVLATEELRRRPTSGSSSNSTSPMIARTNPRRACS